MTIFEMLGQSGVLTLLGMGVVFSFLVILVICVSCMGRVYRALGANKDIDVSAGGNSSSQTGNSAKTTAIAAAITAAVNNYRKENS